MATETADAFDPEVAVIEAIRCGDRYAFSELVGRQSNWVRGVIFSVLGDADRMDDVAQQVWTVVWQRITELRDAERWRPWLFRIVRNAAIDAGREITRRRRHTQTAARDMVERAAPATADDSVVREERSREVLAAVRGLPALYREPFVLRHMSGWSYRQIADVMGMPVDSVETRLVRARRFLRESLKETLG